jgi:hypothetical protein
MQDIIIALDSPEDAPLEVVGGKAHNLMRLTCAGLRVPPGFTLTTEAYRAALRYAKMLRHLDELVMTLEPGTPRFEQEADGLREAIREHPLPGELEAAITEAYAALGKGACVAVRSSAISEDLTGASFAGQYTTVLGVVGAEALLDAVRACWASLWNPSALLYRRQQGIPWTEAAMGVVVQRQIPAEAAGVLFTLNPLNGRESEMVVEACWGLGESVVSGRVTPDRTIVDAEERRVLEKALADKATMVTLAPDGGTQETPVPETKRRAPTLDDESLFALADLGYAVQALYGAPQDVEWALYNGDFYLLQARPLTAITYQPEEGQWTSANYREVMPGFVSPLSFALTVAHDYARSMAEFMSDVRISKPGQEVTRAVLFYGRAYWRLDIVKQLLMQLPGFVERRFDATVGIEPTYEGDGLVVPFTPRTIIHGVPILLALGKAYDSFWKESDAWCRRFRGEIEPELDGIDPAALSDDEANEWTRRAFDLHWQANKFAMTCSYLSVQAQDDFHPMMEKLESLLPEGEHVAEGDLITGLGDVGTADPNIALWDLAQMARADPTIARIVRETPPDQMVEALAKSEAGCAFWAEVEAVIQRFRRMADNDEDLTLPRWDEDPTFPLTTLQRLAALGEAAPDPRQQLEAQRRVREEAEARVAGLLKRRPSFRRSFFKQVGLVQRYAWWREETREVLGRVYYTAAASSRSRARGGPQRVSWQSRWTSSS